MTKPMPLPNQVHYMESPGHVMPSHEMDQEPEPENSD